MRRVAALFAIIAFAVMAPAMAHLPLAEKPGAMPMAGMAMAEHVTGTDSDRKGPCEQAASMSCNGCCILVAPMAASLVTAQVTVTSFAPAYHRPQLGRVVPPALPPPRG